MDIDPHNFLNNGIRSLGVTKVSNHLRLFGECYTLPIVSVGSGMGAIESLVKVDWICVDPDWKSFATQYLRGNIPHVDLEPFVLPEYKNVKELVGARPEIVGNCCVFLNWCDPNYIDYDAEAIELLKPCGIMAVIERCFDSAGAAGGVLFHKLYEDSLAGKGPYTCFHEAQAHGRTWFGGNLDVRLVWLHRRDDKMHSLPPIKSLDPRILPDNLYIMSPTVPDMPGSDLLKLFSK